MRRDHAVTIALLLDNPERDLPGLALVATSLAAAGVRAYLVPMNLAVPEVAALAPDLVLLSFVRRTNEGQVAAFQRAGVRTALLDTEGGVLDGFDPYERIMAQSPAIREGIRPFLAWGSRIAGHARRAGWYPEGSIRVTGHPRFDLYTDPWRSIAAAESRRRIDQLVDPGARVVLVAGTFTLANPRFSTPQRELQMLVDQLGLDPGYVEHRLECERRALQGLTRLAASIARRRPDVTVVVRPHPFEDETRYRRLLDGAEGVRVVRGGAILPWLLRARSLVQRGSTTAVEAVLAGVPVLEPAWLPAWAHLDAVEAASSACGDTEELLTRLDDILEAPGPDGYGPTAAARRVLDEWFVPVDGRAHERVATALRDAAAEGGPAVDRRYCRRLHYQTGGEWGGGDRLRPSDRLRMAAGLPRTFSFRRLEDRPLRPGWEASGKAFDATSVGRWVEALAPAVEPGFRPVVRPARETGAYGVSFPSGRSVEVRSA